MSEYVQQKQPMKVLCIVTASAALVSAALAADGPSVIIKRAIVINGAADASVIGTAPSNVTIGITGCGNVNNFGTALQFQFVDGEGTPINVTDFKVTSATYTLYRDGVIVTNWNTVSHGAYNPVGDTAKPDLLFYDTTATQVSVNGTQVTGTNIPTGSKFQVLDQQVTLGTASRPKFTTVGQYYRLERTWTFTYVWNEQSYTRTLVPSETSVNIRVSPDLPGFNSGEESGPFMVGLQVSENLVTWVEVDAEIPYPRPTTVEGIEAFFPRSKQIAGFANDQRMRFYRYTMHNMTP